jgi:competence protein CoiA
MLVALNENDERCNAWLSQKSESPFRCPACKSEVTLKKGPKREHHYAHKPPTDCAYGAAESPLHLRAKREIYQALVEHPDCKKCEIERNTLEGVRPDISLRIRNVPVAIEIQCSAIDVYDIIQRTRRYSELGIYLVWIIPQDEPSMHWRDKECKYVHRIKEWVKFLHTMYCNQVYFWQGGLLVQPYEFEPLEIEVEEKEWPGEYGEIQYSGGYTKKAKSLTVPRGGNFFNIVDDFKHLTRRNLEFDYYSIPDFKLWIGATGGRL